MIAWLLSFDWSWLFDYGSGINYAIDIIFFRQVVSVTGASSGLKYAEVVFDDVTSAGSESWLQVGIQGDPAPVTLRSWICLSSGGRIWYNGSAINSPNHVNGPTFTAGQVGMFAFNFSTLKAWVGKVGTGWYNSGDPAAGTGQTAILSAASAFHISARVERLDSEPLVGIQKFSLRTQSSQFTGTIPSGFSPWYP
jgi:hypothetical protein